MTKRTINVFPSELAFIVMSFLNESGRIQKGETILEVNNTPGGGIEITVESTSQ